MFLVSGDIKAFRVFCLRLGIREFDMKCHILQVFKTSTEFIKKSSDHFKDIYKLKLLTTFDVYMTSFLKGVSSYVLNH